jgi:iron(III) transport system ATP-binding protein
VGARVSDVSYFGHDAAVRLDVLPGGPSVLARVHGHDLPAPGSEVWLTVTGDAPVFSATTTAEVRATG